MSRRKRKKQAARARLHAGRKARLRPETEREFIETTSLEQLAHSLNFLPIRDTDPHYRHHLVRPR
ncbi:hypothetical protein [Deinococcus peraridilitoris]|uniref:Uncharacterized protein n=1 Tax=Deinococcus peraridilitoris (strain DSM 19664 / LMG 22246 / CIP 109416 / KR-200) TaxID=937777 RepID=L0A0M2_DEIPD|nr:hypothetical protein [Deinococcus peraridilitoris]AFZ67004.1 hypothetical protein Deipe_1463 [Deinococcus peraridilitoris DSM 19664]